MSEQEIAAAMDIAGDNGGGMLPPETEPHADGHPETNPAPVVNQETDNNEHLFVPANQCIKVFDYVNNNAGLIVNWKKVNLTLADGTALTDTQDTLVGVDSKNIPFSFNCKNLMIPTALVNGATEIKVLLSGIIIKTPTANIYVSKNNIFSYVKNAEGATIESYTYYKVRGDRVGYKNNGTAIPRVSAEMTKLEFKVSGGRIYNIIVNLADINEIRNAVLTFLNEKVSDINYCIKIENICFRCGF